MNFRFLHLAESRFRFLVGTILSPMLLADAALAQTPSSSVFRVERINALILMALFSAVVLLYTRWAKQGKPLFIRKIAGLDAVEEAVLWMAS